MLHRLIEPIALAPILAGITAILAADGPVQPDSTWITMLIGPASGLLISLVVLYFLKGYYDRSIARDAENRSDVRNLLERVVEIATKQQEQAMHAARVIEENTKQTQATNTLLTKVTSTLGRCQETYKS